jgi:hypothetical protein
MQISHEIRKALKTLEIIDDDKDMEIYKYDSTKYFDDEDG